MVVAWGFDLEELDNEDVDEIAFIAICDSDMEEKETTSVVSILNSKKICICFKRKNLFL